MKTTHALIGGGIVVAAMAVMMVPPHHPAAKTAAVVHTHYKKPHAQGKKTPRPQSVVQKSPSPVAQSQPVSSPSVAVPAALNQSGTPLWHVKDPQNSAIQWAFLPQGVREAVNGPHGLHYHAAVLWFGQRLANQTTWHWTPIALPGKIPKSLPHLVYQTLLWAYDLHVGEHGPTQALGTTTWDALTGRVSEPQGWQASAYTTPTGTYTVSLTPWMASTSLSNVYFGLSTTWTAHNATNGTGAIATIVHDPGPLSTLVHP